MVNVLRKLTYFLRQAFALPYRRGMIKFMLRVSVSVVSVCRSLNEDAGFEKIGKFGSDVCVLPPGAELTLL